VAQFCGLWRRETLSGELERALIEPEGGQHRPNSLSGNAPPTSQEDAMIVLRLESRARPPDRPNRGATLSRAARYG
jgi:hypothetical protein